MNFSVGGTATFNTDYTQSGAATFDASSGTVSFGAGDTTKTVTIDPNSRLLRYSSAMRVAVAIRRGEQFAEISEFGEARRCFRRAMRLEPEAGVETFAAERLEQLDAAS